MTKRTDLLVKAAMLFYKEEVTQTEIAKILGVSRPTVATLLQEAKDKGIVRITIQHTEYNIQQRQEALEKKYDLKTVIIAPNSSSHKNAKIAVGACCVEFIERRLSKINNLGIGWGTTIYEYVQQANYRNFSDLSIVPLIGGMGMSEFQYHSNHLAFILAQKYGCNVNYFYSPAIADTVKIKKILEDTELVRTILNMGKNVDMAIMGVGNPVLSSSYRQFGYIHESDVIELEKSQAIGDIGATFFDKNANAVDTNISEKMIGISLTDLINIPDVIVLATGKEKVNSIKPLIHKKVIDHLIIDNEIAEALLE
ncbi:sugar-binding transcriptional regulator [Gilliamella sp. wkB112]|uniref:sugar-binding transcriptional regulator n=1 Tax=Gilliamella sp. wkB112 TaxID=3120257 RepID=UPI00080D97FC|nr:sugar-binding domain-containing protein [Gilliamella apicola]OCG01837.1 hypothetical protein A9G12_11625 [Gilliamella apicola]